MLKRLLSLFGADTTSPSPAQRETIADPEGAALIRTQDDYGREVSITRDEWRDKYLLPGLQLHWDDPEALHDLVQSGLDEGFSSELKLASQRLVEIDPDRERGHGLHSLVLTKSGLPDKAEATLHAAMHKLGKTPGLLMALARIQDARGKPERAASLLWQALQADPNRDEAIVWWLEGKQRESGDAGYREALEALAALPGAWRATLYLARTRLAEGHGDEARDLATRALARGEVDSEALALLAQDLRQAQRMDLLAELVGPHYRPERDDPRTGLALLGAYLALDMSGEGEALLAQMSELNRPELEPRLMELVRDFAARRAARQDA
ncbi:tetratricopeptide repeat protein [Paludibacterium paludis]|uniref:Tetratricopeptide repeat protein n=1 Tax=Paludibacterium paludis TaxID=1225769 RepID=A0A918P4Q2_9NEIS|nr:hypothetical protein [Paludibacterium paludis]GGY19929.1 hypothetical protein GCM10011289_24260 [Paludibacterium paludis]